jgi:hypothetical protein
MIFSSEMAHAVVTHLGEGILNTASGPVTHILTEMGMDTVMANMIFFPAVRLDGIPRISCTSVSSDADTLVHSNGEFFKMREKKFTNFGHQPEYGVDRYDGETDHGGGYSSVYGYGSGMGWGYAEKGFGYGLSYGSLSGFGNGEGESYSWEIKY